jgi:hypothetical protein
VIEIQLKNKKRNETKERLEGVSMSWLDGVWERVLIGRLSESENVCVIKGCMRARVGSIKVMYAYRTFT